MRQLSSELTHFTSSNLLKNNSLRLKARSKQTPVRLLLISLDRGGGGERDRTDDLLLAKQALSQLSYTPLDKASWWVWLGSNQRPPPYQDGALTS